MALYRTQRYTDFNHSLEQLKKYVDKGELTELESPGFIQTFEFVSELPYFIDTVTENNLNAEIKQEIDKTGQLLYNA